MNCYAPDWLVADFSLNSGQTTQNPHQTRLKTVNGDAIYCVAVKRCRRSRKTGFQHVQESGSSTAGNHVMASRRTTHHTIHRRFDSWLDSRVTKVKKNQNDDSTLESSRHKLLIVLSESSMTLWRVVGKSYTNRRRLGFTLQKVILRNLITHN